MKKFMTKKINGYTVQFYFVSSDEMEELDDYVRAQAERVPVETRVLITAHDAFNYFGRAYGFQVRGLQGISTAAEAGTGDVQSLVGFIVERKIPAMFIESSVPPRNIEAVQAAVKSRGFDVRIVDLINDISHFDARFFCDTARHDARHLQTLA